MMGHAEGPAGWADRGRQRRARTAMWVVGEREPTPRQKLKLARGSQPSPAHVTRQPSTERHSRPWIASNPSKFLGGFGPSYRDRVCRLIFHAHKLAEQIAPPGKTRA